MFADQLRRLREAAGLSQYELARRSGLTKQALSKLERGEREPGWHTVQLLALALGVECWEFKDLRLELPDKVDPPRRGRPSKAVEEPAEPAPKRPRGRPRKDSGEGPKDKRK